MTGRIALIPMRLRCGSLFIASFAASLLMSSFLEIIKMTPHAVELANLHTRSVTGSGALDKNTPDARNQRIAIVQYIDSDDNLSEGYRAAISVMQKYAKLHRYHHYMLNEQNVKVKSATREKLEKFGYHKHHWRKPFYLSTLIHEGKHEWLAYFDTDVVITDPTQNLETWIDSTDANKTHMIITDDPTGICNGVFFQKATNWSLKFNELWWDERQVLSNSGHDNWPFMAALLKSWAVNANYSYDDECSMARRADMESWSNFYPCYSKHLRKMGRTTHPSGCTEDFPDPCGSAYRGESPIVAAWGINKGYGFGGKNAWTPGSFLLHLAGHPDRERLLLQHSADVLEKYFSDAPVAESDPEHRQAEIVLNPALHRQNGKLITVWPISFSAPEEIWVPVVRPKTRGFATIIPGNLSTYTYEDEDSYYNGYRSSMFAVTRKKAGWDCMRHLEIMASGCVPYFLDLDNIPPLTLQFYPKSLFAEAKSISGVSFLGETENPESFRVDMELVDFERYYDIATRILEHSRKHLTTRAMAKYLIRTITKGGMQPKHVLMATNCIDDYLTDSLLHGLKKLLGSSMIDFVPEAHTLPTEPCVVDAANPGAPLPQYRLNMYMDSWAATSFENFESRKGYGKGFTIWNRLSKQTEGNVDRSHVYEDITEGKFDFVILSDRLLHQPEQKKFVEHVQTFVPPNRTVVLLGGDLPAGLNELESYSNVADWIFQREIY